MRSPRRSSRRRDDELPTLAASMARSVRAGATLLEAFGDATNGATQPLEAELARLTRSVRRGTPLGAALDQWSDAAQSPEVALFVAACRFGQSNGGDLAAALDGAAVSLLDRIELADEARALTSQARASAAVLVALPLFGAVGFSLLDPSVATTLLLTPAGWLCLTVGLALDALGALVLARMVRGAIS